MRLFESEGIRTDGKTLATFHPECGDVLLDYCEKISAQREVAHADYATT
jgi:hypothetical protein